MDILIRKYEKKNFFGKIILIFLKNYFKKKKY